MSLSNKKKFLLKKHYDEVQLITAKELVERIIEDRKSNYNWIAPARNLVKVCKNVDFPKEYAIVIYISILNCFANIEHFANNGGDRYIINKEDAKAVEYCYNSLYGLDNEDAILARRRYLKEILIWASHVRIFDPLYHPGPTFVKLHDDWNNEMFDKYISKENLNFDELIESLEIDFANLILEADKKGAFDEDEKKDREEWKEFYSKISRIL